MFCIFSVFPGIFQYSVICSRTILGSRCSECSGQFLCCMDCNAVCPDFQGGPVISCVPDVPFILYDPCVLSIPGIFTYSIFPLYSTDVLHAMDSTCIPDISFTVVFGVLLYIFYIQYIMWEMMCDSSGIFFSIPHIPF